MELTKKGRESLRKLDALSKMSPDLGFRIIKEVGADSLKEASKICPKDSDSLVSTGRMELKKARKIVTVLFGGIMAKYSKAGKSKRMVNYAGYVHDGTYKMPARPFLQKGVNRALTNAKSIGMIAFKNWVSKVKSR